MSQLKVTVTTSTDSSPSSREKIDCGDIQETSDGFILNFSADDALLGVFRGETELYQFYASQLWSVGQVRSVPADNYYRKQYELLVEKNLAKRGQDIDLESILTGLRLKDLNAATQDLLDKPMGRKAKAV